MAVKPDTPADVLFPLVDGVDEADRPDVSFFFWMDIYGSFLVLLTSALVN